VCKAREEKAYLERESREVGVGCVMEERKNGRVCKRREEEGYGEGEGV
jgi:hypothetical protein